MPLRKPDEPGAHVDLADAAYAQAVEALMSEHGVVARNRFVTVEVERPGVRRGPLRTWVTESGDGPPMLLVNGSPGTASVWAPLLGSLEGVHAIAVDRPGHGLTGAFDYAELSDLRAHAVGFLESVLDALELDQVVVTGNSVGGLWGLWLAIDRPERVSAIVQLGLPPGLLTDRLPLIFGLLAVPRIAKLLNRLDPPSARSVRRLFKLMGDPPQQLGDAFVEAFVEAQRLPKTEGGTLHQIQRFVRFPGRFEAAWLSAEALAGVRQPTLLVAGRDDFLGGLPAAERMTAAIPDATLEVLGQGHLPWLQDSDGVARAVERFVRGLG
jgi:pimeloyl-ACP methyl ester carboxylesterase